MDPEEICVHPENQEKKLLEIAVLGVGKSFGDHEIMDLQQQPISAEKSMNKTSASAFKKSKTVIQDGQEIVITPKEPHSVVSMTSCELFFMSRMALAECLSGGGKPIDKDDLCQYVNCQQYYPDDKNLRRLYYEETNWQGFKGVCGQVYQNMRQTPQIRPPFQKDIFKQSRLPGMKEFSKYY